MRHLDICGRLIGPDNPCFIIAEAGVNHNGDIDIAHRLVDAALAAGADAVKFQTFNADRLVLPDAPKANYQERNTGSSESQLAMLRKLELSEGDHQKLFDYCHKKGIQFISTPFDELSADMLARLKMALFKIPSGEITNLPYLKHIARFSKPMIVSTGMANLGEVETAVKCIEENGNPPLILLHCVSNYPSDPSEANLLAMNTMAVAFDVPVGFSDHTLGNEVSLAAVALGACIIEKHLTLDKVLPGPDHMSSLAPAEFATLVRGIRAVEAALGNGRKAPTYTETDTGTVARKSLVTCCALAKGEVISAENIAIMRPGTGLPPAMLQYVMGYRTRKPLPSGTILTLNVLE